MRAFGQRVVNLVRLNWPLLLVLGALVVAFLALRTPASPVSSAAGVDEILHSGRPALVEFFSNT